MLTTEISILLLLLVACLSAVAFRAIKFPYTVGLVIIGIGLGFLQHVGLPLESLKEVVLSPDLILFIFVPPLIFESAVHLENRQLMRNLPPILILAGPGLIVAMLIVAALMAWLTPLAWGSALLFGALISATDPVAVIALFKEIGAAKRLTVLVEGESMLNDATAIVAFELILFIVSSGALESYAASEVLVRIVIVLLGGLAVGWAMGHVLNQAMRLTRDDELIQATISLIIVYLTFIIAEHTLHVSGVIAVMTAGLVFGHYKPRRLSARQRTFFHGFWAFAAFLANSLIFLLVGLSTAGFIGEFQALRTGEFWLMLTLAIAAVLVARAIIIFGLVPSVNRFLRDGPLNRRYQTVMYWGGLRGAIALALVLSLDASFADRDLLIALTLGVVLFSIIVCGTSIDKLIRKLKLDEPTIVERLAQAQAVLLARQERVNTVAELQQMEPIQEQVAEELKERFQEERGQAAGTLQALWRQLDATPGLERQALWLQASDLEQQGYQQAFDRHLLSEATFSKLQLLGELKREAVLASDIPPPVADYEDLEAEWDKKLPGVADSSSAAGEMMKVQAADWVKKLPDLAAHNLPAGEMMQEILYEQAADWEEKQQYLETLQGRYEFDMAIFLVAEDVAEQIDELSRQQCVNSPIARECAEVYRDIREQTLQRLQGMAQQKPELIMELQRRILQQSAQERASNLLVNLSTRGVISSSSAKNASASLATNGRHRATKSHQSS